MPSTQLQETLDRDRLIEAEANGVEVAIYELIDRQPSGWYKDGTQNMPTPLQKDAPSARKILNVSAYANSKGKGKGYERIEIRHIFGAQDIELKKQVNDIVNPDVDGIIFTDGRLIVTNEGSNASLFKFLRYDSRNETSKFRIPGTDAVYREIFPEKDKEDFNEIIFAKQKAYEFIQSFVDKTPKGYTYKEERLSAYCKLFKIYASTPAGQVQSLISLAEIAPSDFLKQASMYQEGFYLEVAQAEQLGIIAFDATRVVYTGKDKVIVTYPSTLSKDDKIKRLVDFFMSGEGIHEYKIFTTELEFKKQQSVNN